jgi:hypothetical protein
MSAQCISIGTLPSLKPVDQGGDPGGPAASGRVTERAGRFAALVC